MKRLAMLALGWILTSCGVPPSTPQSYGSGANYSSTPCTDNCGGDAQCQMYCTNTTATSPLGAPGLQPGLGVNH
jgi:hypothetical protein